MTQSKPVHFQKTTTMSKFTEQKKWNEKENQSISKKMELMTQSGYFYNLAQFYQFNFYNIVFTPWSWVSFHWNAAMRKLNKKWWKINKPNKENSLNRCVDNSSVNFSLKVRIKIYIFNPLLTINIGGTKRQLLY